jgi:hypothetical protein
LQQQLISAQDGLRQMLLQINAALPGKKNETERNADRAEATALEAQQEQKIRAQQAQQNQYSQEDYQVRYLRATGQTTAADDLAFKEQQDREYATAVANNADQQTLDALKQAQLAEAAQRASGALDSLTASLTNGPTGFKIALDRYLASAATLPGVPAITPGTDTIGPVSMQTPTTPMYPAMPVKPSTSLTASPAPNVTYEGDTYTLTLQIDGATLADPQKIAAVIGPAVFDEFSKLSQQSAARGGATRLSTAQRSSTV